MLQALKSAQAQTYPASEILVVDSGSLIEELGRWRDERTRVVGTGETKEMQASKQMPSWALNEFIPQTTGEWIVSLCDDDLLLPTYLEAFALAAGGENLERRPASFYTGEFRVRADERGYIQSELGLFRAERERGPGEMDCQIDYLQFVFNRAMWERLCEQHEGRPFPEEKEHSRHADGIFMERAVAVSRARPVEGVHCVNRRTPVSRFCGG